MEVDALADPVLVAVDPGLTTGVAMFRHGGLPNFEHNFTSGQVEGRGEFMDTFDEMVEMGVPLAVVCESYTITGATAQKSQQVDALYIIGALEYVCRKLGFPFELQSPAQAKSFATDEKLQAIGWYAPGNGHANDAARHALRAVVAKQIDGHLELLAQIVDGLDITA